MHSPCLAWTGDFTHTDVQPILLFAMNTQLLDAFLRPCPFSLLLLSIAKGIRVTAIVCNAGFR